MVIVHPHVVKGVTKRLHNPLQFSGHSSQAFKIDNIARRRCQQRSLVLNGTDDQNQLSYNILLLQNGNDHLKLLVCLVSHPEGILQ